MKRARRDPAPLLILMLVMALLSAMVISRAFAETPDDDTLRTLPEIESVGGVLTATLVAEGQKIRLGDATVEGMVYNGEYGGPVLRVHPGDVMRITLVNHLIQPTNLHFHGITTSPQGNGDNTNILVEAGQTFDYEVKIPKSQPPGLYWYHAHAHGLTERQVTGGLSGALIVEGFAAQFPGLAGIKERLLVLKEFATNSIDADDVENPDSGMPVDSDDPVIVNYFHGRIQTINGSTTSRLTMNSGETQLWHFANHGANLYFHLRLKDHQFRVVGEDGVAVDKALDTDILEIAPGSRLDVLVTGGPPGTYDLVSEKVLTGSGGDKSPNRALGQIIVRNGAAKPVPAILAFPSRPDLRGRKIDAYRTINFSQLGDDRHFFINGRMFDHDRIDIRLPLGNVEEWTIRNDSDDLHVFHIHQLHFQVVEVNGETQPFGGYVDIVNVPLRGEVKIRLAFTDPRIVGRFVYHCHVLKHEDNGMMANIEVYDPKSKLGFATFPNWVLSTLHQLAFAVWAIAHGLPPALCG